MYGTLLGAIREEDVIPHDTDYDISIFIPGDTIKEVHENFYQLCSILYKHKMLLKVWTHNGTILHPKEKEWLNPKGQMHVATPDRKLAIDVWLSWKIKDKLFLHPFIYGDMPASILAPYQYGYIRGIKFVIPNKPIEFLNYIYGETWDIPQQKKPKLKRYTMDKA